MSEERLIEEVRPKILATGTSNINMYHSVYEGEMTDPNVGMTQYKGTDKTSISVFECETRDKKNALNF